MDTQKMVRISLLVSLATVFSIIENQLPIPRPLWLKLGLANIITLVALMMYGIRGGSDHSVYARAACRYLWGFTHAHV